MDQLLQIVGALLVLAGYAGAQIGILDQRSYLYLLLNLLGSAVLAVLAFQDHQWGFLLLEGAWAFVSGWGVVERARAGGSPRGSRLPQSAGTHAGPISG